ncbi:Hydroxypyruvate reductase [Desulfarculus baarsii DSM 2075]|uniref:Hydroxypyruvate reductase n=1 Tax=Desulfarculus baarsii (strain ATCC 33931 / DSM 2075 / LMG 7858 / VKM B-1802 / 2st14) TaxID=644282 RepID=E1QEA1_DESB2|nr:glycerate kinase [Desulfarculus baarsii]ADK83887.1 Hydroxypyruvate reductase [Desulfarculus baarsii DSM 2075]
MSQARRSRQDACKIIQAALEAADPARAVSRALRLAGDELWVGPRRFDLRAFRRIVCVGAGKAGQPMAQALEAVLGPRLAEGVVVVKDGHGGPTALTRILEASHPVPDQRGVTAAQAVAELLARNAAADTLVFCLLSGGGSALLPAPAPGLSLADKQEITRLLLASGADIGQINAIRKHLSALKGGNLARLAGAATVVSLIISDVVGDRLDVIASGPTVADESTWAHCRQALLARGVWEQAPAAVRQRIEDGLAGRIADTPKADDPALRRAFNLIVASNRQAIEAAAHTAASLGYTALILSTTIEGETKDIARMHAAIAREALEHGRPVAAPFCLLSGGETTVSLGRATGLGGRNQEFALAAAPDLAGLEGVLAFSLGTDGTDGPTDAAGAWADGQTMARAEALGLDQAKFLANHDAYHFFQELDDLIITGPTRTNVMDVRAVLGLARS